MFYSLLGRIVWKAFLAFLRMKYGRLYLRKRLLAAGTVAIALAVMAALQRNRASDS